MSAEYAALALLKEHATRTLTPRSSAIFSSAHCRKRAPSHTVGGISTASRGGRHTTVAATVAWVMIRLHPCGVRMRQICCHLRRTPAHPFAFRVSLRSRCIDRCTRELCCDSAYSACSVCSAYSACSVCSAYSACSVCSAYSAYSAGTNVGSRPRMRLAIGDRRSAYDCVLLQ
jgi:hypothetical protein